MRAAMILATSMMILTMVATPTAPSVAAEPLVDRMTCPDAQAYALTHGYYWKSSSGGPPMRITGYRPYPVVCTGRDYLAPHFETTGDGRRCVLGWYCHLM